MTDLEKFIELYSSLGIYVNTVIEDGEMVIYLSEGGYETSKAITTSDKFNGYGGFFSDIVFDLDGNFLRQGFWE